MEWLISIFENPVGPAHLTILFALTIWLGVKLGKVKIFGISLGVTFVLFVGILLGHLYNTFYIAPNACNPAVRAAMTNQNLIINFVKELGLILFVYCIGVQVGPGFFATFKKGGVGMNLLSVLMILLNVGVMSGLYFLIYYKPGAGAANQENLAMMTGVMFGAVTNTPGLGAANSVLPSFFQGTVPAIGNGYACAYPLGVVGIILTTLLLRILCKINLKKEKEEIEHANEADATAVPHHFYVKVTNKGIIGKPLREIHDFLKRDFVCSRAKGLDDVMFIPNGDTILVENMKLMIVSAEADCEAIQTLIGERLDESWRKEINETTTYVSKRMVVTKPEVNGKTFNELHISTLYNVNVTRVTRSGMEMFARRNLRLQLGDRILVTGAEENVERIKELIGDTSTALRHPNVGTIFLGILIGVLVGQIPIPIPGVEVPVKLGLAGGPLIVAILIGAFGYKFHMTSYITTSANLMLREIGLCLFLAGVGIQAGATFWDTITHGDLNYVWIGFIITVVPIIIGGLIGHYKMKLNYLTLMGLIAGTYTDPPALAFANQTANNDAPAIGYSTVYPLSMFLRILTAQLVLLVLLPLVG